MVRGVNTDKGVIADAIGVEISDRVTLVGDKK
jgi:hypothetical protein